MNEIQSSIGDGIGQVWSYGNIAVTVLFLCLIGSAFVNFYMLRFLIRNFGRAISTIENLNKKVGHDELD